jgi:hypothetical protein
LRKNAAGRYEKHRCEGDDKIAIPKEQPTYGSMQSLRDVRPAMLPLSPADASLTKALKKKTWYVSPKHQLRHAKKWLENQSSRDLNTHDFMSRELNFYMHQSRDVYNVKGEVIDRQFLRSNNPADQVLHSRKPELHTRLLKLKIDDRSAEEIINQLESELKLCIVVGLTPRIEESAEEDLSDFGIRVIDYKPRLGGESADPGACLVTDDSIGASMSWIPQIYDTSHLPVAWSMNYVVPKGCRVASTGSLVRQMDLPGGQALFTYKLKRDEAKKGYGLLPPDKIGFAAGHFIKV